MNYFIVVDNVTGFPKIVGVDNKIIDSIVTLFVDKWLSRYLRPWRVVHDNGGDFVEHHFKNYSKTTIYSRYQP